MGSEEGLLFTKSEATKSSGCHNFSSLIEIPSRNQLCFCGSGKKYKKCCLSGLSQGSSLSLKWSFIISTLQLFFRSHPDHEKIRNSSLLESQLKPESYPPHIGEVLNFLLTTHLLIHFTPINERLSIFDWLGSRQPGFYRQFTHELDTLRLSYIGVFRVNEPESGIGENGKKELFMTEVFSAERLGINPAHSLSKKNYHEGDLLFAGVVPVVKNSSLPEYHFLSEPLFLNKTVFNQVQEALLCSPFMVNILSVSDEGKAHSIRRFYKSFPFLLLSLVSQFHQKSVDRLSRWFLIEKETFNPSRVDLPEYNRENAELDGLPSLVFNSLSTPESLQIDILGESPQLAEGEFTLAHWCLADEGSFLCALSPARVKSALKILHSHGFNISSADVSIMAMSPEKYSDHMAVIPSSPGENLNVFFRGI